MRSLCSNSWMTHYWFMSVSWCLCLFLCLFENNMHMQFWCVAAVTVFFIVTCNESHMCCQHCDVYVSNNHCCIFLSSLLSPRLCLFSCYLCRLLLFFLTVFADFVFDFSSYPESRALNFMCCDHIVPDTSATFCDWILLSQSWVFGGTREWLLPLPSCLGVTVACNCVMTEKVRRR